MREVERAWRRKQFKRRVLIGSAMGAFAIIAIGIPAIYVGGKLSYRRDVLARREAVKQFDREIGTTVARDIEAVMGQSGLCGAGCAKHDPNTIRWQWQIAAGDGALLVDLYAWHQAPDSYVLIIYGLSPRPDGALSENSRISQTLVALLERFHFPDATQPFAARDQSSGNSKYRTEGPTPVRVLWQPFPGKDRMRAQWLFTVSRTGPFAEEGSWLAER